MKVVVPKETTETETRVALTPDSVKRIVAAGMEVIVQSGAGAKAHIADNRYEAAGASLASGSGATWGAADLLVKINPPTKAEVAELREGAAIIALLQPLTNHSLVRRLAERRVTAFSLESLPRISRAQSMDVLSSMSTVAGYKAVLLAAAKSPKFMPMLVTAAGTIAPAKVFVLGAGVAGLQAIATARRLGAVVKAFDVRPVVKEQVESLGAVFVAPEAVPDAEGSGGYATELSQDQHQQELKLIHENIKDADIVITTALIPGKQAPVLITEQMVRDMPAGSVIVDLAAEMGGNCELTEAGQDVVHSDVTIMGPVNLPASTPIHASQMFSKNVFTLIDHLVSEGTLALDFDDEITKGTCITHDGKVIHEMTQKVMEGAGA